MSRCKVYDVKRERIAYSRATEADYKAWKAAALADGRKLSDWINRRCNGAPAIAPVRG